MSFGELRVGWVTAATFAGRLSRLRPLPASVAMRVQTPARWMNDHVSGLRNELYRPQRRYDIAVFFKAMDSRCRDEALNLQAKGTKVVFDANVNYYEVSGTYDIPGTRPTQEQQADAIAMSTLADWVVTDSSYLLGVVTRFTDRASWIPDNVNLGVYGRPAGPFAGERLRLVWSGVSKKAAHLMLVAEALSGLPDAELVLVSDERPAVMDELERRLPCSFAPFGDRRYARLLTSCDAILSPKRLTNAYELAHSEYKITLGMAAGLPAVASPQQSYVEAIGHAGGGFVAASPAEWSDAFDGLRDPDARSEIGERARRTVVEKYSTPVVARTYADLLLALR